MSRTASVFMVAVLLAVVRSSSTKCVIWPETGPPVQRGSSLSVFCHFFQRCSEKNISSDHRLQTFGSYNASTILVKLVNITERTSFLCQCRSPEIFECGLDLVAGYPPDRPENMSCSYIPANSSEIDVHCFWAKGRKTYLWSRTSLSFRFESKSRLQTNGWGSVHSTSGNSAQFSLPGDAMVISVKVQTQNKLGAAESIVWNYTLSDIVKPPPPALGQPHCSSSACTAHLTQVAEIQYLQIQHRTSVNPQMWKTSEVKPSKVLFSPLEPNTLYEFKARWRFSTGHWSEWSTSVSHSTQEEAPAEPLDVWWIMDGETLHVYWKEMNSSTARGTLLKYFVEVKELNFMKNLSEHQRNTSVPTCPHCQVEVSACNSKGCSPPAIVTYHAEESTLDLVVRTLNNTLLLNWSHDSGIIGSVVEWYREGHRLHEVQWVRLGRAEHRAVITEVRPLECYKGAVHVFSHGDIRKTKEFRAAVLETVPTVGPSVQDNIEENTVTVTWAELPSVQRGGCLVKYNVYLENSIGRLWNYSLKASETNFTKADLHPDAYSLWMSASTAQGEGPAGRKVKFFISADNKLSVGLACAVLFVLGLGLLLLCQCSTLKQRLWGAVKYFYEVVPDPANSRWAKESSYGIVDIHLQLSEESVAEDLPILDVIEELPQKTRDPPDCGKAPTPSFPLISYIKSHSNDSESSGHTEHSQDTTEEYISSHLPEYQEEEEEDEFEDMLDSFSGSFVDAQEFGGHLTLDAVKVNCG